MNLAPVESGLIVVAILFVLGLIGVLVRRNILFILLSIEIMLIAAGLAFIVAGSQWNQPDGQIMYFFILAMAAAEVARCTRLWSEDFAPGSTYGLLRVENPLAT